MRTSDRRNEHKSGPKGIQRVSSLANRDNKVTTDTINQKHDSIARDKTLEKINETNAIIWTPPENKINT